MLCTYLYETYQPVLIGVCFRYIAELHECGRLQKTKAQTFENSSQVEKMLEAGYEHKVVWATRSQLLVPSSTQTNVIWDVNLVTYECACPMASREGKGLDCLV